MIAFVGSQVCFALFWRKLLRRSGVETTWRQVFRAYGIGTLGKYVPGKACVVLIRTGLLPHPDGGGLAIGLTVVYETLAMMAAGGVVACLCLLLVQPQQWTGWVAPATVAGGFVIGLHPAIFGRLAALAAPPFTASRGASQESPSAVPRGQEACSAH